MAAIFLHTVFGPCVNYSGADMVAHSGPHCTQVTLCFLTLNEAWYALIIAWIVATFCCLDVNLLWFCEVSSHIFAASTLLDFLCLFWHQHLRFWIRKGSIVPCKFIISQWDFWDFFSLVSISHWIELCQ